MRSWSESSFLNLPLARLLSRVSSIKYWGTKQLSYNKTERQAVNDRGAWWREWKQGNNWNELMVKRKGEEPEDWGRRRRESCSSRSLWFLFSRFSSFLSLFVFVCLWCLVCFGFYCCLSSFWSSLRQTECPPTIQAMKISRDSGELMMMGRRKQERSGRGQVETKRDFAFVPSLVCLINCLLFVFFLLFACSCLLFSLFIVVSRQPIDRIFITIRACTDGDDAWWDNVLHSSFLSFLVSLWFVCLRYAYSSSCLVSLCSSRPATKVSDLPSSSSLSISLFCSVFSFVYGSFSFRLFSVFHFCFLFDFISFPVCVCVLSDFQAYLNDWDNTIKNLDVSWWWGWWGRTSEEKSRKRCERSERIAWRQYEREKKKRRSTWNGEKEEGRKERETKRKRRDVLCGDEKR